MNIMSTIFTTASRNDINNYLKIFIHSFLPAMLSTVASVLISLSFWLDCCLFSHFVISFDCRDERAIKFMQLFSVFFYIRRRSTSSWLPISSTFLMLCIARRCFLPVWLVVVFGVFRLTPLTFYRVDEMRWTGAERILRFFMASFGDFKCMTECWTT